MLFSQIRLETLGTAAFTLAIAAVTFGTVKTAHLILWLALVVVALGVRYGLALTFSRTPPDTVAVGKWNVFFVFSLAVLGLTFGGMGLAAGTMDDLNRVGITLFALVAMSICTIPLYGGALTPVLSFTLPAMLPAGVYLLGREQAGTTVMGVSAILTPAVVALAAYGTQKLTRRIFAMEAENAQMRSHLDVRREQVEKLTISLKSNAEKRQKAEVELRRTSADLGLVKGKAQALSETLSRVSPLCPVTGIANRRTFDEHLDREWRRAMRERKPLSLLMCEIDHFDAYQDSYGRPAGDALLNRVAKLAAAVGRRAGDLPARYDGPRFALVLAGCDTRNAARMAEALRKRIEGQKIPHSGAKTTDQVTAHLGVATMIPTHNTKTGDLIERIETAMYEAKFQGGNRVVAYRALAKLRLERWDAKADGPLTAASLVQKLLILGYEGPRSVHAAGSVLPDTTYETETVCAVLTGEFKIVIEGQSMALKPGESLFIPPGMTYTAEVVGTNPVVRYEAKKSA